MPGEPRLSMQVRVGGAQGRAPRLDLALDLGAGITALMGHSGAGKTTLLATIAGLVRPSAGRIVFDHDLLFDAARKVFVPPHRRRVSLVFQSLALFPHLKVWENVAYGVAPGPQGPRRAAAIGWLERARIAHLAERLPSTLSGGEAQRVAIARALAAAPRMLLLDEPFSALDVNLRLELGDMLRELVAETRVPTLLVTHDHVVATRLAPRILWLKEGLLVDEVLPSASTVEQPPSSASRTA